MTPKPYRLLKDIMTPSARDESLYLWSLIAIGHAMLGAALITLVGIWLVAARLPITAAYWLIKERGDLARKGMWRDGLVDTGFVGLGTLYGAWWWPLLVFACVGAGLLWRALGD